jgi:RNA polymerase sigma-70 factor (ECF subfamily)
MPRFYRVAAVRSTVEQAGSGQAASKELATGFSPVPRATTPVTEGRGVTNAALAQLPGEELSTPAEDDFSGLYRTYHPQLFRYVTHHFGLRDADEITQESLTRALRSLERGRSAGETWAWLIRVARNVAHDLARARRVCDATDDETVLRNDPHDDTVLPEPAALLDERRRIVRRALTELPPGQRRILVLYEVDELPCPAIARLVGSTEDAVRKALQRARRRFAREIRSLGGGVFGSAVGLLRLVRPLRRRVRGLPTVSASTAMCALAGTFALTVAIHPATPVETPSYGEVVASRTHGVDPRETVANARAAATRAMAARSAALRVPQAGTQGGGSTALLRVPQTPLSPGRRTVLVHEVVDVPVVGPVVVEDELYVGEGHGPVCSLDLPGVTCD